MKERCEHERASPIAAQPLSPVVEDCCASKEGELAQLAQRADVKRILIIVLLINFAMFLAEFSAGIVASSTALMADSVDMLGDALV